MALEIAAGEPLRAPERTSRGGQILPAGTVTFLFTDIEGSTRLLQRLGEQWKAVLEMHNRLLHDAIVSRGGVVARTEGDAFFAVFTSTIHALTAAIAAQRALAQEPWPAGVEVRVRMGLHTGEATLGGDEYVGLDVHRAARIAAAAHGGQILLSAATRALVQHALPTDTRLVDVGEHRLKDLSYPEHLYQVCSDGLRSEFPPPRSLNARTHNLPIQLTSFVGREREVAAARQLLGTTRLLTLTGPGGTGKTRLALQVAAESIEQFPDGVYFVALASVTAPDLVPTATLQALGLQDSGSRSPRERLQEYLADRHLLLVLDNFEQVLAAGPWVGEVLRAAPRVKALVTSRAALHTYGERELPVPPLRLPDPRDAARPESLTQYEAVQLFIERATAAKPDFQVTNENAPAVAEICARLDGLPLAIELAAARVKLLPPEAMLRRLEHRLGLLSGGARDLPARQQTLRGAIAWSYDLLGEDERTFFRRLAVFAGGCRLAEVEAVCGNEMDVLEGVGALVDHSLLRQEEIEGEARFFMLETIREYALERLEECGEAETIRQRHATAYVALAQQAAPELTGRDQKSWLDRLEREHDNLRAALDWCVAADRAETAMRLIAAIWRFWHMRGHLDEARRRIERVLALPHGAAHPDARLGALEAAGSVAYWRGDMLTARAYYARALELSREIGDPPAIANALYNLSFSYMVESPEVGMREAVPLVEEALALYRALGDRPGVAKTLWERGNFAYFASDYQLAERFLGEALAVFRELDDRFGTGWALHMSGLTALRQGDIARAGGAFNEALQIFAEARDVSGLVLVLDDHSALALEQGDLPRAARLAGASSALKATSGATLVDAVRDYEERLGHPAGVKPEMLEDAWTEGRAMTQEQAVAYALCEGGAS